MLTITIALGIYSYGFRETTWERTVDDEFKKEEKEVFKMNKNANSVNEDGGIKL